MAVRRALFLALGLSLSCAACGGSDGNGNGGGSGAAGADQALAQESCFIGLQVPGVSYSGSACSGTDLQTHVTGLQDSPSIVSALRVNLELGTLPAVGALDLTKLTVDIPDSNKVDQSWQAPMGGCTAQAPAGHHSSDPAFNWDWYRIDVSCSADATAINGNPGAPLTLGDFTIVSFFAM